MVILRYMSYYNYKLSKLYKPRERHRYICRKETRQNMGTSRGDISTWV